MPDDVRLSTGAAELSSLLNLTAEGDEGAFASLYEATAPRVFGLALRMLGDQAQAEELAREVYLEIWRGAAGFDERAGTAIAWMMSIAHRKAVTQVRSTRAGTTGEPGFLPASRTATSLVKALLRLSLIQRESLEMAYLGGHTHGDIAGLLGVPASTVSSHLRTGLLRLREVL